MNATGPQLQSSPLKLVRTRSTLQSGGNLAVERMSLRPVTVEDGAPGAHHSRLASVSVGEVMTPHVFCVAPDVEVESLLALLIQRGISGVPVVNERGLPVGMVSKTDIVRHLYEDGETRAEGGATTAGELMLPLAFTLLETASLSHAAALMAWEGVHRLPICSDAGDVVGILSSLDVVRWLSREEGYPVRRVGPVSAPPAGAALPEQAE
jgi:CBS domain-containing protein